jgi:hypothetical protein
MSGCGGRNPNPRPAVWCPGPPGAKPQAHRRVSPSEGNEARREGHRESHSAIVPLKLGNSPRRTQGQGRALPTGGPGGGHQGEHIVASLPVTVTSPDSVRGVRPALRGVTVALPTRSWTNRMPQSGTSGRVHQTAPIVTSSQAAAQVPKIGVSALLQLADWYHGRGPRNQQGGSACANREPPSSPPAPAQANTAEQPEPTVAGPARRQPRADSQRAQPRRGRTPRAVSHPAGGDA